MATGSGLPKSNRHQSHSTSTTGRGRALAPPAAPVETPHTARSRSRSAAVDHSRHHHGPPPVCRNARNLVVVCCHAIFHPDPDEPGFPLRSPYDEQNWHLAPFQRSDARTSKAAEHVTFLSHLSTGIDLVSRGPGADDSMLVLSGGATKPSLTPRTEARSYYHAALSQSLAQGHSGAEPVRRMLRSGRLALEEHATDSLQNVLFSVLLFRRATGAYPAHVCVVTHAFKAPRFLDLHGPALRWPADRLSVVGQDPPWSRTHLADTLRAEHEHGYAAWHRDPLATGDALARKRRLRGWSDDAVPLLARGLEHGVGRLLRGEGADHVPWGARPDATQWTGTAPL